jgi:4-hydroxy-tetrahydrodipicolinate reductase
MVVGTTGLSDGDHAAIDEAGKIIPVLQAPNMSLGVNLLFALAARAARQLGDDYDIEIVEAHHRFKVDAPSGTALGIARAICDATGKDMAKDLVHGREGESPRQRGQIGMHALRLGDVVGRHTVSFATLGEELQLTHNATSRDVFARGALRAAQWLAGKPAGRYGMADVLGLRA